MKFELFSLGVLSSLAALVASQEQVSVAQAAQDDGVSRTPSDDHVDAEPDIVVETTTPKEVEENSNPYFPWTHKPVCTAHLDDIGDKLCVYTNATFGGGRGISIFTTPPVADMFASLPPFQDPKALSSRGINPTAADAKKQAWYTAAIPGKGMGMRASRPLQRGDLITAYTPYLLAHMENILSVQEREQFLRIAVDQLPTASRNEYLSLAKIYNEPSVVVQDVLKANLFEIQIGGLMHLAVFPEAARFNHNCSPNAQYFLSGDMVTHYVHAVRPIKQGEELTISYAPPLRMHSQRQLYFEENFHFTCTCPRCSPPRGRTIEDVDKATSDILSLSWALSQWTANSTASVKKAEMLIDLYKAEGLDAFLDDAYGHAALMYNSVGSARGAKKYAKLAAEASWLKYGYDGGEKTREWEAIAVDPMGHGSWRRRSKSKKEEL